MRLRQKQSLFAKLLGQLLVEIYRRGYECTMGECYRPQAMVDIYVAEGLGSRASVHPLKLAVDLNLFKDGRYQRSSEAHRPFGEYWKSLHPLCRWGGDFRRADGNHYSLAHGSRA